MRFSLPPEPAPLASLEGRSWHPWLVVGLVSLGAFVGQVDATIVQLALPALGRAFSAPLPQVSWVALAYLLAFASFLPIFGRLCEMFGRKSLYLAGYALFIAASALCALADSLPALIAFRVLQGIGGAVLGANSIAILVATVPQASRGRALGIFAAAQAIGMSAGPALGGLLLEAAGWRAIFWVTVPFGAVALGVGWLALPRTATRGATRGTRGFDVGGALLIGPALVLTVMTLNHLAQWGPGSPLTLGALAAAGVLFALLVRRERSTPTPLINPRLFATLAFRCGAAAVSLAYALLYGVLFLMSFALEHGYGESPAIAGLRLALMPVALGLSAPLSHDIALRLGPRRAGPAAMLVCLCGIGLLLASLGFGANHYLYHTLALLLLGTGLGLFIAPNTHATIAAAAADLSGAAGSLLNLMRVMGTSLGVAVGASMLTWRLEVVTGSRRHWFEADSASLLEAARTSLPVLALLAVAAALCAHVAARGTRA